MKKCIYCGSEDLQFNTEHVIPRMFGRFDSVVLDKDFVCKICNSKVFSRLETQFMEDSLEGLISGMHRIVDRTQIRLRMKNLKIKMEGGYAGTIFEKILPQYSDSYPTVQIRSFFATKYMGEGINIFWLDKLAKLDPESYEGKRIKSHLTKLDKKDMHVITYEKEYSLDQAYGILKKFGVNYREKERKRLEDEIKNRSEMPFKWEINESTPFNSPQTRILAKTAFNYFAFNIMHSSMSSVLYSSHFDTLRHFVLTGEGNSSCDICLPMKEPVIVEDQKSSHPMFGHTLTFSIEQRRVIATVSFFGQKTFKVILGQSPFSMVTNKFGGGHFFFPVPNRQEIYELSSSNYKIIKDGVTFGLYRR